MIHSMDFVKSGPLNTLFWKSPIRFKLIWIESWTPAEYLVIYKKLLTQSTTQYFLKTLDHYGVRGIVNDWFTSYLTSRKQISEIGPLNISKKATVSSGVLQGSVLGPLLFLIYINDICNSCNRVKFYLFADDTNLLYADKNLKSLESTVNDELCKLYDWLIAIKLSLNIK